MAISNFELRNRIEVQDFLGYVQGISLPTVLQMVSIEKTTCLVCVYAADRVGHLFFLDGALIDAEVGDLQGEDAAYELIGWRSNDIEIKTFAGDRTPRIECSLTMLLLESSRRDDERKKTEDRPELAPVVPIEDGWWTDLKEEGSMNTLHKVLESFREEVPEFVSTDIVNVDSGLSIGGGSIDPDFDASVAAASYAEVVKANGRALDLLGMGAGSTEDILISTEKIYVLIRPMGKDYYHVLAVGRRGNLGLARAIMKKYEPKLLAAVGELS